MSMKANQVSVREKVYNDLRMAILTGKISPETRLVESALAKEMGVSRTPIRDAYTNSI
jgi:DNA-binding GntR family transcriptional regulator